MHHPRYGCIQTGIIIVSLLLFPMFSPVHAALVINEVFPKPSDETSEWIELYNTGPQDVVVSNWSIRNAGGTEFRVTEAITVPVGGFLTLYQSQTGMSLDNAGDTVSLYDASGTKVDEQSYPSILGYNTSMGRSHDSIGSWSLCTPPATPNLPNNCPIPTITPTPLPTSTPTRTPTPTLTRPKSKTPTPTAIASISSFEAAKQYVTLHAKDQSATHSNGIHQSDVSLYLWTGGMIFGVLAALAIILFGISKRFRRKN